MRITITYKGLRITISTKKKAAQADTKSGKAVKPKA